MKTIIACAGICLIASTSYAVPDISGTYDVGTLTPLERPEAFGNNLFLSEEAAAKIAANIARMRENDAKPVDPNRAAPEKGGNFRGYNMFWVDPGTGANVVDGKFRTSIITHPENGRLPPMTEYGAQRLQGFLEAWRIHWRDPDPSVGRNDGTAWWLQNDAGIGPYDHIEQRPLAERCIIGSRSTAGPPMLPNFYNNFKRIIQTDTHIMILTEMNHDARVIRLNGEHRPGHIRTWLGDSIGYWQDGALVVDTTNFTSLPALSGADENLHVVERFTPQADGGLFYQFTVHNPGIWQRAWQGEYSWPSSDDKVYEYACHEGNYALGNIMRGARLLEKEAQASAPDDG
jgi:hypothetical protein